MTSQGTARAIELLDALHTVVASALPELAGAFSDQLRPLIGHSALLILGSAATARPQKAGDPALIGRVSRPELDAERRMLATEASDPWGQQGVIGGSERPIIARTATTGALLVLIDPELTAAGAQDPESTLALIDGLWQLVARSIQQRTEAPAPAAARAGSPRDGSPAGSALSSPQTPPAQAAEWGLSPREQDVFTLVASGARNKAIGAELDISDNTVKFHVANLLRKLGASTRAELAARART